MDDKRYAVLIDSDNISSKYISNILDEMTKYGVITYKRIYGDWTSPQAGKWKKELMEKNKMSGLMFKMTNDPRVTKVGEFIRKTSLDELPELVNILKGDMKVIYPEQVQGLLSQGAFFLDVSMKEELDMGTIPGSVSLAIRAQSPTGQTTPVSLFACISVTSKVSGRRART